MPKLIQYQIVKLQLESFRELGFKAELIIGGFYENFYCRVRLTINAIKYEFYSKNWGVVSSQLADLYWQIKKERHVG